LIRLSIGTEHIDDIITDLEQRISARRMAIFEEDSQVLQNKYFPETEAES